MIVLLLLAVPAAAGALALAAPRVGARAGTVLGVSLLHLVLVGTLWARPAQAGPGAWISVDALGLLALSLVSFTFAVVGCYVVGYLRHPAPRSGAAPARGGRMFAGCLLLLLAAATLVCVSQHMALLWVGLEAVTLSVAPLIYHERNRRSLEAVWKYLVLSSVGIALALLGTFFLATAQEAGTPLLFSDLMRGARTLHPGWLQAAFVFLLLGYGLKMGLAPLHTWKPDTYGEAPSLVGALMAADVTACAFLGLARVTAVAMHAGIGPFVQPLLIGFALLSLGVAATFMLGQRDLKRMLAYSSVEHMGLLALGLGVGGVGSYGAVYHLLNNGLAKAFAFLAVGNIVLATGTARLDGNRALLRRVPLSAGLLLAGLLALTGSPPFGTFLSMLLLVRATWAGPFRWAALLVCALLAVLFVPFAARVLEATYGDHPTAERHREGPWLIGAPLALAGALLVLGLFLPVPLGDRLAAAAVTLGGQRP